MRIADQWQDFEILDTSSGEKLERWGNTILIRPDPQVIWRPEKGPEWQKADARYNRSSAGGGSWQIYRSHPQFWTIGYRDLKFKISPTGFKHTGLFPEQAVNWDFFREKIGQTTDGSLLGMKREDECGKLTFSLSKMELDEQGLHWVVNIRLPYT